MKVLEPKDWLQKLIQRRQSLKPSYRAMYSTWFDGLVMDYAMMVLPIDDHGFHRGDAVFEALKSRNGKVWLFEEHIERLFASAQRLQIKNNYNFKQIKDIFNKMHDHVKIPQGLWRVYLTRGPGSFSANPYDCPESHLHIILSELLDLPVQLFTNGVNVGLSQIPAKTSWMAQIKSCNYLPNVMMKKEAVDLGYDFVLSLDREGGLTEGSVENFFVIDQNDWLIHPPYEQILSGTTMKRLFELVQKSPALGLRGVREQKLTIQDAKNAKEMFITGTTLDVLPVRIFDSYVYQKKHSRAEAFLELLKKDQTSS